MIHLHQHPDIKNYLRLLSDDGRDLGNIELTSRGFEFYPARGRVSFSIPELQTILDIIKEQ